MAQLKDTTVDGNLNLKGNIFGNVEGSFEGILVKSSSKIPSISFGNASVYGRIGMNEVNGRLIRYRTDGTCYSVFDSSVTIPISNGGTGLCCPGAKDQVFMSNGSKACWTNISSLKPDSAKHADCANYADCAGKVCIEPLSSLISMHSGGFVYSTIGARVIDYPYRGEEVVCAWGEYAGGWVCAYSDFYYLGKEKYIGAGEEHMICYCYKCSRESSEYYNCYMRCHFYLYGQTGVTLGHQLYKQGAIVDDYGKNRRICACGYSYYSRAGAQKLSFGGASCIECLPGDEPCILTY